jgi:hypothetical protein
LTRLLDWFRRAGGGMGDKENKVNSSLESLGHTQLCHLIAAKAGPKICIRWVCLERFFFLSGNL